MDIFDKLQDYQEQPVRNIMHNARFSQPNGIVFFGDSLIQGFDLKKYFKEQDVYNCGCDGATSDLLLHLNPYAINDYRPRKVILLIGTNDLSDRWQFDRLEIAFNVFKLITIMQRQFPEIEIVVISPLPIDEARKKTKYRTNLQLKCLGADIKSSVLDLAHTSYVDVYDSFMKDGNLQDEYTVDGLHLSEKGYDVLASLLQEYIKK